MANGKPNKNDKLFNMLFLICLGIIVAFLGLLWSPLAIVGFIIICLGIFAGL